MVFDINMNGDLFVKQAGPLTEMDQVLSKATLKIKSLSTLQVGDVLTKLKNLQVMNIACNKHNARGAR